MKPHDLYCQHTRPKPFLFWQIFPACLKASSNYAGRLSSAPTSARRSRCDCFPVSAGFLVMAISAADILGAASAALTFRLSSFLCLQRRRAASLACRDPIGRFGRKLFIHKGSIAAAGQRPIFRLSIVNDQALQTFPCAFAR